MDDVNYLAARLDGAGNIEIIESDLPLDISTIDRRLSAPPSLSGSITNEVKRLKVGGRPIFEPWKTAILVEEDGQLRGGGIYRKPTFDGAVWRLDVAGFTSYAQGTRYDGAEYFVGEDPLNIFRHIWTHIQAQPKGNLGITVDPLTSPVKVGTALEQVQFQAETQPGVRELVSFEAGPRKLNWYQTFDLGREIDDYAKETPFDWEERLTWLGDEPDVHIALGYPQIGGRRDHMRLVLGENLATEPTLSAEDYASEVFVLGAGEGRDRVQGRAGRPIDGLRRTKVVEDKSIKSVAAANALADRTLSGLRGEVFVEQLEVHDHPNARLEGIQLGDEIPLYAETDWYEVSGYARIVGRADSPGRTDVATLTVVRVATP